MNKDRERVLLRFVFLGQVLWIWSTSGPSLVHGWPFQSGVVWRGLAWSGVNKKLKRPTVPVEALGLTRPLLRK